MENLRELATDLYSSWAQGTYLYSKWAAKRGINYHEMLILYALSTHESITQKAIADYYGLPKQTVNNVIRGFKSAEYVELASGGNDKREKLMRLTDTGNRHAQNILEPLYQIEEKVLGTIGKEKAKAMIDMSELFNTLFEKESEKVK